MICEFRDPCPQEDAHVTAHPEGWHQVSLRSTVDMDQLLKHVVVAVELLGYSGRDTFGIRLALEEAIINAIKHGHGYDSSKQVQIRWHLTAECLLVEVQDEGPGFHPEAVPDPLAPENIECEGGRGLLLMRSYMTWVCYNECGNCVTLCKRRSEDK